MAGRAETLAARFRAMNEGVIRFAAGCPEADWRRMVPHEGRSVAYLIDHIAFGYRLERRAVLAFASGEAGRPPAWDELPPVYTMEDLAANNAARWEAEPYPGREETIMRLRDEGERTARVIEGLGEADLERPVRYAWLPEMTLARFLERVMIGHAGYHLPGIERELAGTPQH